MLLELGKWREVGVLGLHGVLTHVIYQPFCVVSTVQLNKGEKESLS